MKQSVITVRRLGTFGRFGNSLFLYAFAKAYADMHGAILQTPKWEGQKIFKINDPPIDRELPQTDCDVVPWGKVNIDLLGYYQNAKFLKIMSKQWLKNLFTVQDRWTNMFPKERPFYAAAHVRRGDYNGLTSIFALISEKSYTDACVKYNINTDDLIWIHEDRPSTSAALEDAGIPYLKDFLTLKNADILLRANSTFSWWAGVLGDGKVYSPVVGDKRGLSDVDFTEGNWPQMANFKKWEPHCPQDHGDLHLPE